MLPAPAVIYSDLKQHRRLLGKQHWGTTLDTEYEISGFSIKPVSRVACIKFDEVIYWTKCNHPNFSMKNKLAKDINKSVKDKVLKRENYNNALFNPETPSESNGYNKVTMKRILCRDHKMHTVTQRKRTSKG